MHKHCIALFTILLMSKMLAAQTTCNCAEYSKPAHEQDDSAMAARLMVSGNIFCRAKGTELMGDFMSTKVELDAAEALLQKAEALYKQTGCGNAVLLGTYETWANIYYIRSDFAKAQAYTFKMLQSAETAGNVFKMATCNTMIAQLFNQTNQANQGIVYTRRAVALLPRLTTMDEKRQLLFLLSKRYLWHYQDTKTIASLDSSELFSWQQLAIARAMNNRPSIAKAFNNLQGIEFERGNYKKALQLTDSSLAYTESSNQLDRRIIYFDKADILIELKQYDEAERFADSALYLVKLTKHAAYIAESYELLARIAKEKGDYKKAYTFNELARDITDSIRNMDRTKAVTELEKKYNQAKNENTISELSKKKQLYLMLAIAALLAVAAIAFFLRQQSLKHKKKVLEAEQRLNRARMNPHFFFNTLAALQKFALKGNDGQVLASNLSKFSNIMRETLESTYKEYVTIEQEMEFLNEYLEVQKIRFPQTFTYTITTDDNVEMDEILIPSMILQPFIENSIEHGFNGIGYPGNVSIHFKVEGKEIMIQVQDNGKGLSTTIKENNEHISRASQIIKDRIYLLNIKLKTKAGFSINNNASGQGVTVKIHLPLLFRNNTNT